jgi:hypothetical protein
MANLISPLDIQQEGRISTLEVKVDRMVSLTEDLHADMTARKARWHLITSTSKYFSWLIAGVVTWMGFSKSESVAGWLNNFPAHH